MRGPAAIKLLALRASGSRPTAAPARDRPPFQA